MAENILTNGLKYAVYERNNELSNLIAVFQKPEDAEDYRDFLQIQNKNNERNYYTKKIG